MSAPHGVPPRQAETPARSTDGNQSARRLRGGASATNGSTNPGERESAATKSVADVRAQRRDRIGSGEIVRAHHGLSVSAFVRGRAVGGLPCVGDGGRWGKAHQEGGKSCDRSHPRSAPTTRPIHAKSRPGRAVSNTARTASLGMTPGRPTSRQCRHGKGMPPEQKHPRDSTVCNYKRAVAKWHAP